MSIIKFTRNTLYQIGIQYVLLGSDKLHSTNREKLLVKSDLEPVAQIFLSSPTKINNSDRQAKKHYYTHNLCEYWCIVLGSHRLSNIAFEIRELHCLVTRVLRTLILCALFAWIYLQESGDYFHEKNNCCVVQVNVKFTVKSLHAGTLVTCWTTAPRKPFLYKRLAQLASILFLFFILSIVTQCYSSTYATKPELELAKPLSNLSPTLNSRIHSSSIILSRIIQAHFVEKEVPHYHHVLLHLVGRRKRELTKHNLNHISEENFIPKTRKRVHVKVKEIGDKSYLNRIRGKSERKTQRSESAERTEILTQRQNGENFSDFVSVTGNFSRVISQKLNQSNFGVGSSDKQIFQEKTAQPMPPAYGHTDNSSVDKWRVLSIILSSVALTVTLGLITCILSHYREGAAPEGGGTASDPNNAALTPTSAPMLSVVSAGATAGVGGMERLRGGRVAARDLAAAKERQVRLHALRTDLAVNLPPSITMPDGEDHPYSNSRIQIRDPEQEAEIYQKCIRPPPNRTVLESESPPPYRSSSAGLLGSSSSSSSSNDWSSSGGGGNAPLVVRCHSMSSTTNSTRRPESASSGQKTDFLQRTVKIFTGKKTSPQAPSPAPTLPAVVVPSGSRRRPPEQNPPPSTHRPSKGGV